MLSVLAVSFTCTCGVVEEISIHQMPKLETEAMLHQSIKKLTRITMCPSTLVEIEDDTTPKRNYDALMLKAAKPNPKAIVLMDLMKCTFGFWSQNS